MTSWRSAIATSWRLLGLLLLAGLLSACSEHPGERLSLLPVGNVPAAELRALRSELQQFYGVRAAIRADRVTTQSGPGQVDADALLTALESLPTVPGERLLAVCAGDGGQRGMNFVLGLARRRGRCGVVFCQRLRQGVDAECFARRLAVEAHHELGHVYGLGHCDVPGCAMQFSATLTEVDRKRPSYCEHCRELLGRWRAASKRARSSA